MPSNTSFSDALRPFNHASVQARQLETFPIFPFTIMRNKVDVELHSQILSQLFRTQKERRSPAGPSLVTAFAAEGAIMSEAQLLGEAIEMFSQII